MQRIILVSFILSVFGIGSLKAQNCQSCFTYAPDVNNSYLINLDATCSTVPANTNYEWFVDGQPYFGFPFPYFQIPFYSPGTYTITLVVSSASCVDSSSQSVTIVPSCNANFTSYQIGGGGVYFSHSGNYSPTASYTWDTGDGFTYSTQMMQHVYQTPGNYNVCLIVSDTVLGGCSDTVCQTVSVTTSVQCIANLNYWLDPVTGSLSASASGSSYNINNYGFTYTLNGQIVQQGSSEFYNTILTNSGNYTLGLYITDNANNPCDSIFQIVNFTNIFGTNCYPCFTTSYNATYDSVYLSSACSIIPSGGGYYWNINGTILNNTPTTFLQGFATSGNQTITLYITDSTNAICDSLSQLVYTYGQPCSSCLTVTQVAGSTSDYVFDGSCTSNALYYSWFIDGVLVFTGNSPQFTYGFTQSGSYNICLQTIDVNSTYCNSTCSTIVVNTPTTTLYDISGQIFKVNNGFNYVNAGNGEAKVYLIKLVTGGILEAIDSTTTNANGYYTFDNKPIDDYRIKVALDPSSPDFAYNLPTYYNYALMWYDAQVVTLFNNTYGKDIYMQYGVNNGGNGFISGNVFQGANKKRTNEDITLILMNTANNLPVAYAKPNASGDYSFNNIPDGTYKVYGELLNRASIPDNIVISNNQYVYTNRNFKYSNNTIAPTNEVLSVGNQKIDNDILILPNPASNLFTIQNDNSQKEVWIYDMTGRLFKSLSVQSNEQLKVDCSNWVKGIYTVNVKSDKSVQTQRMVIE